MAALLRYESRKSTENGREVVILWLHQPNRPVIVLDRALLESIDATLDRIAAEFPAIGGLVVTSDSRVFIAGADLKEIMAQNDPSLHAYLEFGAKVFGRLATMPCTTVAAINGAALGGGLELAMHCDVLIASKPVAKDASSQAKPYAIGLPETGLKICPGWGGTNLLPARMEPSRAIHLTAVGSTLSVFDAAEAGLIDHLVAPDALIDDAVRAAAQPKSTPRSEPICIANARTEEARTALAAIRGSLEGTGAGKAVAEAVDAGLQSGWPAALQSERDSLVALRHTPEAKAAIEAFFAKSSTR